jgi:hypothetical protein
MKRIEWIVAAIVLILGTAARAAADEPSRFVAFFGPRVGLTCVMADPDEFDARVQELFPNKERSYVPFMTQFGITFEQRLQLGSTNSHFAFQEVIVGSGIDQGVFLPSASFLIGFRSGAGLELGLGPVVSFTWNRDDGTIDGTVSVVYAIGWTIPMYNAYIPINLAIVPTPEDGFARISLVSGFNFRI